MSREGVRDIPRQWPQLEREYSSWCELTIRWAHCQVVRRHGAVLPRRSAIHAVTTPFTYTLISKLMQPALPSIQTLKTVARRLEDERAASYELICGCHFAMDGAEQLRSCA